MSDCCQLFCCWRYSELQYFPYVGLSAMDLIQIYIQKSDESEDLRPLQKELKCVTEDCDLLKCIDVLRKLLRVRLAFVR